MANLPRNFLSKQNGQWREVRMIDLAALLYNVIEGAVDKDVGFEDTQETLDTFLRQLNKKVLIDPRLLESALWSCNMLDEKRKFWHPKDRTFEQFAHDILGNDTFNRTYNVIEMGKK